MSLTYEDTVNNHVGSRLRMHIYHLPFGHIIGHLPETQKSSLGGSTV